MGKAKDEVGKDIARNRRAYHDYEIVDRFEAGLVLIGSEVKSLRERGAHIRDAYAHVRGHEAWLVGLHITEYANSRDGGHDPGRTRKLLLHRREIEELDRRSNEKGLAVVPLRMYWNDDGRVKVELGLGRGKAEYDKRRTIADRDSKRDLARIAKLTRR